MKIQNRSGSKLWTLSDFAVLSAMGQQYVASLAMRAVIALKSSNMFLRCAL